MTHGADPVAEHFDAEAARYDAAYDDPGPEGYALRERLDCAVRILGDGPGDVLDAGMGPGRLCVELRRRGWTVAGVDASPAMVALARRRLAGGGDLRVARLEALPFADGSFDAVAALGVLEYVDDLAAVLAELARVLRPRGRAVLALPNPRSLYGRWRRHVVYPGVRLAKQVVRTPRPSPRSKPPPVGADRLCGLLGDAGLALESARYVACLVVPTPLDLAFPRASVALAQRLAPHGGERRRRLLATQVVYAARRAGAAG